jgi:hypothetical protein
LQSDEREKPANPLKTRLACARFIFLAGFPDTDDLLKQKHIASRDIRSQQTK